MDYIGEAVALAVNGAVFTYVVNQFWKRKTAVKKIEEAPLLDINNDLSKFISSSPSEKTYVALRGTVVPIGQPIKSVHNDKIEGVIQVIKTQEHVVQRTTGGFWSDHERVIQESKNVTAFALQSNGVCVEIVDPLSADILDLDVISDVFIPTTSGLMEHLYGFMTGLKQKGIQKSEHMLRTGTILTGIGELTKPYDGTSLKLQPLSGSPFYLTNMHVASLLKTLMSQKHTYKVLAIVSGVIGVILCGFVARKYYKTSSLNIERKTRRTRRTHEFDESLPEIQICIVCKENPREVILLPCGHVCLCEDCADQINDSCPLCRTLIQSKTIAYLS